MKRLRRLKPQLNDRVAVAAVLCCIDSSTPTEVYIQRRCLSKRLYRQGSVEGRRKEKRVLLLLLLPPRPLLLLPLLVLLLLLLLLLQLSRNSPACSEARPVLNAV